MPLSSGNRLLTRELEQFMLNARLLGNTLADSISQMAAGSVSANLVLEIYTQLGAAVADAQNLATVPDILNIARREFSNDTFDFVAEATAFVNACQNGVSWIDANFPVDANGWLQTQQIVGGSISTRAFDDTQTATLRPILQAVVDAA